MPRAAPASTQPRSAVMGSRSTDLKAGFGGYEGRALKEGDRLPVACPGIPEGAATRG